MELKTLNRMLLSQYVSTPEERFITSMLEMGDRQFSDPLERFTYSIELAEGPFLDRIGELLGIVRAPIADTNVTRFGFADEDQGFGRGALSEHLTSLGPTLPLNDTAFRRILVARAITLSSTEGIEDAARAASVLFDNWWVYLNDVREWARAQNINAMAADHRRGVLLGLLSDGTRYEINPRTAELVQLPAQASPPVGSLWNALTIRANGDMWLFNNRGAAIELEEWSADKVVLGDTHQNVFPTGVFLTGVGTFEGSEYVTGTNRQFYEMDFTGDAPVATVVGVFPGGDTQPSSVADAPGGMLVGTRVAFYRVTGIPDMPTGEVSVEEVFPTGSLPSSSAYYGGRIIWFDFTARRARANPLFTTRGFTVFGTANDSFYLEAVRNARDKLISRPAGVPMQFLTETIRDAT